jgi:DNA polymerase-3 subunit delta'
MLHLMEQIVGQPQAVNVLQQQLASGRLHHAYVFHGPVGVGKCTTAVTFARLLLCHNRQAEMAGRMAACGACESCRLLAAEPAGETEAELTTSAHPDLHLVRKELASVCSVKQVRDRKQMTIPVDLLRELVIGGTTGDGQYHEAAAHKSAILRHGKVFIIDEAELLDAPGQNALLKTLEEPPPGTTLILVTSSEDRLLPTIRSRCQRVPFVPLSDAAVEQWLSQQATLDEEDRRWLTLFAGGSLGRARIALDYDLVQWAKTVLPAMDAMAQGRPQGELGSQIAGMIDELAKAWVRDRPKASKDAANRLAAGLMWSMIAAHARQQVHEQSGRCEPDAVIDNEARLEPWLSVIDTVREAERLLATNVNLSLVCDHIVGTIDRTLAVRR